MESDLRGNLELFPVGYSDGIFAVLRPVLLLFPHQVEDYPPSSG